MRKVLLLLILAPVCLNAQTLVSSGAISVLSGAVVHVNGGAVIAGGSLENNGSLTVSANATTLLPGTFSIAGASVVSGNGIYRVERDWINNAVFNEGTSTVELFGNTQQFITSTNGTITQFHNLTLSGTGTNVNRRKSLVNVDSRLTGVLALNDRELETQMNTFSVITPVLTAITNSTTPGSEGFVSSLSPGKLTRTTDQQGVYLFPTGSSVGVTRYRPVEITTSVLGLGAFSARLNNFDATVAGFDRDSDDGSFCIENPNFFHSIERIAGTNGVDIRLFYLPVSDGSYAGMGHWRTTNTLWNNMGAISQGTAGQFSTLTRSAWNFVNPGDEYILTNVRPDKPQITCPLICENSDANTFTAAGTSSNYQWVVPSGGTIVAGQGTNAISVDWTTGTGYVLVTAVENGCASLPDSCQPSVYARPVANFDYALNGSVTNFSDLSINASEWNWNFGDGNSSEANNPSHEYNGGEYVVVLTAYNPAGCSDAASKVLVIDDKIVIPNVFSPNGDGLNDVFLIKSAGLKEYSLNIINRWGETVFTSKDNTIHWDGKQRGELCSDGVYFYVLKATSLNNNYEYQGMVTLVK